MLLRAESGKAQVRVRAGWSGCFEKCVDDHTIGTDINLHQDGRPLGDTFFNEIS